MLKIAIIDDDIDFLKYINQKIKEVFLQKKIQVKTHMFTNGEQMVKKMIDSYKQAK